VTRPLLEIEAVGFDVLENLAAPSRGEGFSEPLTSRWNGARVGRMGSFAFHPKSRASMSRSNATRLVADVECSLTRVRGLSLHLNSSLNCLFFSSGQTLCLIIALIRREASGLPSSSSINSSLSILLPRHGCGKAHPSLGDGRGSLSLGTEASTATPNQSRTSNPGSST